MEKKEVLRIFNGAAALITGGASGIGRALAEELARRGCEVTVADLQIDLAGEVASGIRARGGKATAVKLDVRDFPSVEQEVKDAFARAGRLDYMFNNAGIFINGIINMYSIDDWNYIVDINLRGVINGVHAAYPVMVAQGFGHIVNTASIAGLITVPSQVAYATTKHAVVGLSKSLRAEAAWLGVRVSALCPGIIHTQMMDDGGKYGKNYSNIPPEMRERILKKTRPMKPELFAKKALDAVAKNRAFIIEPSWWRLLWLVGRLFPEYAIRRAQASFEKILKELGVLDRK